MKGTHALRSPFSTWARAGERFESKSTETIRSMFRRSQVVIPESILVDTLSGRRKSAVVTPLRRLEPVPSLAVKDVIENLLDGLNYPQAILRRDLDHTV